MKESGELSHTESRVKEREDFIKDKTEDSKQCKYPSSERGKRRKQKARCGGKYSADFMV